MLLILVRHAEAGESDPDHWPDDDLRPVSAEGRRKQAAAARGMKQLGIVADHLFTSPLVRAMQTAEILAEVHGMDPADVSDALGHGCTAAGICQLVADLPESASVMVVGHEPTFSHAAAALIGRGDAELELKKSGVIGIDFDGMAELKRGRMIYLLKPGFLRKARH